MDTADWVASVIAGLALLAALVGVVLARQANEVAKESNRLAKGAAAQAEAANGIAEEANQISRDANSVSERALAVSEDDIVYHWRFDLEENDETLVVTNDSAHTARNVAVFVRYKEQTVGEGLAGEVPAFGQTTLHLDLVAKDLADENQWISQNNAHPDAVFFMGSASAEVQIHLTWTSENGVPRSDVIKKTFS